MRRLSLMACIASLAVCSSCGGAPTTPATDSSVVAGVQVIPDSFGVFAGGTTTLSAFPYNASGQVVHGKTVQWSSGSIAVATVSTSGEVTGVSAGTTTIAAMVDGKVGTATVTVRTSYGSVAVVSISVAEDFVFVPGQALVLTVIVLDAYGIRLTGRAVTLTSSNPAVATYVNGIFRPVSAGTTTVTATSEGVSGQTTINVHEGGFIPITGGQATAFGGAVSISFGALTAPLTLVIDPTQVALAPAGFVAETGFDVAPTTVLLDLPATIKIQYPASAVTGSVNPANFRLEQWNGTAWVPVPGSTVDVGTRTVTGTSVKLGSFVVAEISGGK
jgi:hypothetical protein